jgi:acyl dehydratase
MNELAIGKKFDFGEVALSEKDIIEFATLFDPLDFHINKEAAKKTIFKDIIASGPHLFNLIYRREWVPRFGKSVICGMGISNWKFIKPVYANQKIKAIAEVISMEKNEKVGGVEVGWRNEFLNEKGELVQYVESKVMHDMSKLG